jgi:thymidine kinase
LLRTSKFSTWFLENEFQTSDYILTCNQQLLTLSAACNTCQCSVD